jgi:hypothetical protein
VEEQLLYICIFFDIFHLCFSKWLRRLSVCSNSNYHCLIRRECSEYVANGEKKSNAEQVMNVTNSERCDSASCP